MLGVAGLYKSYRKGNVGLLNAPGSGVADDKVIYSYVLLKFKYYLDEEPKLDQVETYLCHNKSERDHVISNISKMIVKPADGSGGYGIM